MCPGRVGSRGRSLEQNAPRDGSRCAPSHAVPSVSSQQLSTRSCTVRDRRGSERASARSYLLTDFLTANESAVISGHAGSEDPRRTPDTSGNEEIRWDSQRSLPREGGHGSRSAFPPPHPTPPIPANLLRSESPYGDCPVMSASWIRLESVWTSHHSAGVRARPAYSMSDAIAAETSSLTENGGDARSALP